MSEISKPKKISEFERATKIACDSGFPVTYDLSVENKVNAIINVLQDPDSLLWLFYGNGNLSAEKFFNEEYYGAKVLRGEEHYWQAMSYLRSDEFADKLCNPNSGGNDNPISDELIFNALETLLKFNDEFVLAKVLTHARIIYMILDLDPKGVSLPESVSFKNWPSSSQILALKQANIVNATIPCQVAISKLIEGLKRPNINGVDLKAYGYNDPKTPTFNQIISG